MKSLSHVQLYATPWAVAYQAPPSMGFSRQEYWRGLPFPSPGDLPNPGIEAWSPALEADALPPEPPGKPGRLQILQLTLLLVTTNITHEFNFSLKVETKRTGKQSSLIITLNCKSFKLLQGCFHEKDFLITIFYFKRVSK